MYLQHFTHLIWFKFLFHEESRGNNQDDSMIHILHSKELMMATSQICEVSSLKLTNIHPEKWWVRETTRLPSLDLWKALEVAYQDLRSAFLHFLQTRGADRPFFIAGHSQGVGTVREKSFCWIGARTFSNCFWQGIRESLHIKRWTKQTWRWTQQVHVLGLAHLTTIPPTNMSRKFRKYKASTNRGYRLLMLQAS